MRNKEKRNRGIGRGGRQKVEMGYGGAWFGEKIRREAGRQNLSKYD